MFLRFFVLSLGLVGERAFGEDQRFAIVVFAALGQEVRTNASRVIFAIILAL
jgi:hypothetical protein